jgi:hypothetical protein
MKHTIGLEQKTNSYLKALGIKGECLVIGSYAIEYYVANSYIDLVKIFTSLYGEGVVTSKLKGVDRVTTFNTGNGGTVEIIWDLRTEHRKNACDIRLAQAYTKIQPCKICGHNIASKFGQCKACAMVIALRNSEDMPSWCR